VSAASRVQPRSSAGRPPAARRAVASGLAGICAALLAAGCGGGARPGIPAGPAAPGAGAMAARRVLAAEYLTIAQAGNRRLERDFDALAGRDRGRLAAADADLRDIAATERLFDRRLAGIAFPPEIEKTARQLIIANQSRAMLTLTAAAAASLHRLHRYLPLLARANEPVEAAVRLIRGQLALPPPETS
jgi:hypothetical protein